MKFFCKHVPILSLSPSLSLFNCCLFSIFVFYLYFLFSATILLKNAALKHENSLDGFITNYLGMCDGMKMRMIKRLKRN